MGGLGGADGQPGYHSPNIGGSMILRSQTETREGVATYGRLSPISHQKLSRDSGVRASLLLLGSDNRWCLGASGSNWCTGSLFSGTSDKPTSAARIVYSLKIAEAGSEPSSTIFITWWSLAERWKTDVKIRPPPGGASSTRESDVRALRQSSLGCL